MTEVGNALRLVFVKISGFFDILDLSFLVSGLVSAMAVALLADHADADVGSLLSSNLGIFLAAVGCYALGLVSFASGRLLSRAADAGLRRKRPDVWEQFKSDLAAHDLAEREPFKSYLATENTNGPQALYVRLWAEVRHSERVAPSLQLLNSYWVKAATYDGLAFAFVLWAGVAFCSSLDLVVPQFASWRLALGVALLFLVASAVCLVEGRRYREYQAKELVATIAASQ